MFDFKNVLENLKDVNIRKLNINAKYLGSDVNSIDPNTTLEGSILTNHSNSPGGGFWYIITIFYSKITETTNRMQIAFGYIKNDIQYRYYFNEKWSEWESVKGTDSGWKNFTFLNSWHNDSSQNPAQYRKVGKIVYLRGVIYNGGNPNRNVAQLPDGYFSTNLVNNLYFITRIDASIQVSPSVQITPQGVLIAPSNMTNGQRFELDGISFLVD